MRVSREQAAENRTRILESAGRLFRENGLDGIGVADIMKDAGLTHGGFYGHFASKEDLAAEACAKALEGSVGKWQALADAAPDQPRQAIIAQYLSRAHRGDAGKGCLCAALASDVARQSPPLRRAFTAGLRKLLTLLEGTRLERSEAARRKDALATMASLVGAVVLARAVDDEALSDEILEATKAALETRG